MNNKFETPLCFQRKRLIDGIEIKYLDLLEVCQGGPAIGKIVINGKILDESKYFGGPFVLDGNFIYIPIYIKQFFKTGFRICRINISTLDYIIAKPTYGLIYLHSIEGNSITFYKNLNKENLQYFGKNNF